MHIIILLILCQHLHKLFFIVNKILQSAIYFAIMRSVTPCDGTCWGLEMMSSTTQKPPFLRDGWFLIVKAISPIAKIVYIENYPDDEKNTYTHLQLSDYKAVSIKLAQ